MWRLALSFPLRKIFAAKNVALCDKSLLVENRLKSFSIGITKQDVLHSWLNRFLFLILVGGLHIILIGCIIIASMSKVYFFVQQASGVLSLPDVFLWLMIWMALSLELLAAFICALFLISFPICCSSLSCSCSCSSIPCSDCSPVEALE